MSDLKSLRGGKMTSRFTDLFLGFFLLFLVWALDIVTGPELAFSIFYIIPIALVAWRQGTPWGCAISFIGSLAWMQANWGKTYMYWDTVMRLGYFIIAVLLLRQIKISINEKISRHQSQGLSQFKSNFIQMTNLQFGAALKRIRETTATLKDLEPGRDQDAARKQCHAQLDEASGFIRGLLATTSQLQEVDSNDFSVDLRRPRPDALVRDALLLLEPLLSGNDVEISMKSPKTQIQVKGDQETLAMVMKDSILNAIKSSGANKTINIRLSAEKGNTSHLSISTGTADPDAVLQDSLGIRIQVIRRIFDVGGPSGAEPLLSLRLTNWKDSPTPIPG